MGPLGDVHAPLPLLSASILGLSTASHVCRPAKVRKREVNNPSHIRPSEQPSHPSPCSSTLHVAAPLAPLAPTMTMMMAAASMPPVAGASPASGSPRPRGCGAAASIRASPKPRAAGARTRRGVVRMMGSATDTAYSDAQLYELAVSFRDFGAEVDGLLALAAAHLPANEPPSRVLELAAGEPPSRDESEPPLPFVVVQRRGTTTWYMVGFGRVLMAPCRAMWRGHTELLCGAGVSCDTDLTPTRAVCGRERRLLRVSYLTANATERPH